MNRARITLTVDELMRRLGVPEDKAIEASFAYTSDDGQVVTLVLEGHGLPSRPWRQEVSIFTEVETVEIDGKIYSRVASTSIS